MGNCQAVEAAALATAVIHHPGGRVERVYWTLTARQVMMANPGHYVAVIITTVVAKPDGGNAGAATGTVKHLKLLAPDDKLRLGHAYRLVTFEEVLIEFGSRKRIRLSKLLAKEKKGSKRDERTMERSQGGGEAGNHGGSEQPMSPEKAGEREEAAESHERVDWGGMMFGKHGQWRPSLATIAEVGS